MTVFESEASIETKLIQQLTQGESQWTFREDLHTFADLWQNFRHILVQQQYRIFSRFRLDIL